MNLKIIHLIFWQFVVSIPGTHPSARDSCRCKITDLSQTATLVDCANLGLDYIPTCVPGNTTLLILNNNTLKEVKADLFRRFEGLLELYLNENAISKLADGAFDNLKKLGTLSLVQNKLKYEDSYPETVFKELKKLRRLYLQGNCDSRTTENCTCPETALQFAKSVEVLRVDGLANIYLGHGFAALKNLKELQMIQGGGSFCSLPYLTDVTFKALIATSVRYIQLERCNIKRIEPNVFKDLKQLQYLRVAYNDHLCLLSLENSFTGLNTTDIRKISFTHWCGVSKRGLAIKGHISKPLHGTSLQTLEMSSMAIHYVAPTFIWHLPTSLRRFSLRDNTLVGLDFIKDLVLLENLKFLDLSFQQIYCPSKEISQSQNEAEKIDCRAYLQESVQVINVNFRTKSSSPKPPLAGKIPVVWLPKNLDVFYIDNIKMDISVAGIHLEENKLTFLSVSSCNLQNITGPMLGFHYLKSLDVSDNQLNYIHPDAFADMFNLTSLFLQKNRIGNSFLNGGYSLFYNLTLLQILDLSENGMTSFPKDIFKYQINLERLILAGNYLKSIDFTLVTLTHFQYLDVSKTEIENICLENRNFFDAQPNLKIDLTSNKLYCNCDHNELVKWISKTNVDIISKQYLRCVYENNTLINVTSSVIDELPFFCHFWLIAATAVVVLISTVFIGIVVAILFHKRWKLRYLYYIGRKSLNPYHPLEEGHINLDIDAYISYDMDYKIADDLTLHSVVGDIIQPFLDEKGFVATLREDILGGRKLSIEISDILRRCRKTVVFLSPGYCRDFWNTFEFNMSVLEGIYTKRIVVILVIVGHVEEGDMTTEIASVVRAKIQDGEGFH